MPIDNVAADELIESSWGNSVANAINTLQTSVTTLDLHATYRRQVYAMGRNVSQQVIATATNTQMTFTGVVEDFDSSNMIQATGFAIPYTGIYTVSATWDLNSHAGAKRVDAWFQRSTDGKRFASGSQITHATESQLFGGSCAAVPLAAGEWLYPFTYHELGSNVALGIRELSISLVAPT